MAKRQRYLSYLDFIVFLILAVEGTMCLNSPLVGCGDISQYYYIGMAYQNFTVPILIALVITLRIIGRKDELISTFVLVLFTGISLLFSVGAYIYLGKLNNILFTLFILIVNFLYVYYLWRKLRQLQGIRQFPWLKIGKRAESCIQIMAFLLIVGEISQFIFYFGLRHILPDIIIALLGIMAAMSLISSRRTTFAISYFIYTTFMVGTCMFMFHYFIYCEKNALDFFRYEINGFSPYTLLNIYVTPNLLMATIVLTIVSYRHKSYKKFEIHQ